eukprot:TRINITY_DN4816_c0_g1_i1.p1 TRINITY_DN4816_c0_g1~~TRINITY_DN4816_c0_g1_i1.p1  ORF type:complete len:654 (-),score=149.03 TRINITY_DN4816_c0_g1_i1:28-1968(-)
MTDLIGKLRVWRGACFTCGEQVYQAERIQIDGKVYHRTCFKCTKCNTALTVATFSSFRDQIYCRLHYQRELVATMEPSAAATAVIEEPEAGSPAPAAAEAVPSEQPSSELAELKAQLSLKEETIGELRRRLAEKEQDLLAAKAELEAMARQLAALKMEKESQKAQEGPAPSHVLPQATLPYATGPLANLGLGSQSSSANDHVVANPSIVTFASIPEPSPVFAAPAPAPAPAPESAPVSEPTPAPAPEPEREPVPAPVSEPAPAPATVIHPSEHSVPEPSIVAAVASSQQSYEIVDSQEPARFPDSVFRHVPIEILTKIFSLLDNRSLAQLRLTCRQCRDIVELVEPRFIGMDLQSYVVCVDVEFFDTDPALIEAGRMKRQLFMPIRVHTFKKTKFGEPRINHLVPFLWSSCDLTRSDFWGITPAHPLSRYLGRWTVLVPESVPLKYNGKVSVMAPTGRCVVASLTAVRKSSVMMDFDAGNSPAPLPSCSILVQTLGDVVLHSQKIHIPVRVLLQKSEKEIAEEAQLKAAAEEAKSSTSDPEWLDPKLASKSLAFAGFSNSPWRPVRFQTLHVSELTRYAEARASWAERHPEEYLLVVSDDDRVVVKELRAPDGVTVLWTDRNGERLPEQNLVRCSYADRGGRFYTN